MNERSFGKGAFSPQEPAPRGQDRGSHSGVRRMASPPPLPDRSPFVDYNAPPEEPTRAFDATNTPIGRAPLSDRAREERRRFDVLPLDSKLLQTGTEPSSYARLPKGVRDWQPERSLNEYGEAKVRRGLAEGNRYAQGQVPYNESMDQAFKSFEASEREARLEEIEEDVRMVQEKIDAIMARVMEERALLRSAEEISSEHLEALDESEEKVDPRARWFDPAPEIPPRQKRDFSHLKDISAFAEPDPEMNQLNERALDRFRPAATPTSHGRRPPQSDRAA